MIAVLVHFYKTLDNQNQNCLSCRSYPTTAFEITTKRNISISHDWSKLLGVWKIYQPFLFSVTDLEYTYFRWFGIIVGTFDIIVGGIGNGLTIAAFASNSRLRNTFNIFIINLSMLTIFK